VSISQNGKFVAMAAPKSESVGEVLFIQKIAAYGGWFNSGLYRAARNLGEAEDAGYGYGTSISNSGKLAISAPFGTNANPKPGSVMVFQPK
jgi:hypothetical protein